MRAILQDISALPHFLLFFILLAALDACLFITAYRQRKEDRRRSRGSGYQPKHSITSDPPNKGTNVQKKER